MGLSKFTTIPIPLAEISEAAQDMNSLTTVTIALEIINQNSVFMQVINETGTSANHITTLQISSDGVNWNNTSHKITGEGANDVISVAAKFVRLAVTTVEGGVSTATLALQGKNT